jgi:hypothetical protein
MCPTAPCQLELSHTLQELKLQRRGQHWPRVLVISNADLSDIRSTSEHHHLLSTSSHRCPPHTPPIIQTHKLPMDLAKLPVGICYCHAPSFTDDGNLLFVYGSFSVSALVMTLKLDISPQSAVKHAYHLKAGVLPMAAPSDHDQWIRPSGLLIHSVLGS